MKCDNLEAEQWLDYSGEPRRCYCADDVDEAIEELKDKLHDVDNQWNEQCKEIAELKAENERLKAKLESVQASAYADSVDAGMCERRLKRTLWLTRAMRAMAESFSCTGADPTNMWIRNARKMMAKAEEYK